jgi:hypothetical protein
MLCCRSWPTRACSHGTTWLNLPADDLTVTVLTQRAADQSGMPAVCTEVLEAARGSV